MEQNTRNLPVKPADQGIPITIKKLNFKGQQVCKDWQAYKLQERIFSFPKGMKEYSHIPKALDYAQILLWHESAFKYFH
jgi:hypothetical protein